MNMFPNMNHPSQHGHHVPCGPFVHPGVYPQTSQQQPVSGTDMKSLHVQLQRERALRENAERELHQLKGYASDLTRNLQYSYWVISQLQQAIRLNNLNQAQTVEASELQEKVDRLQQENDLLRKALQTSEVKVECKSEEKLTDGGFDVNEIYGTKNELLLMALNYDMTSRPKESTTTTSS
uniref:BZIP domain-containing protein n=1 Tax=Haemonchus contortus TaxID=6289 RepID=A0A7I5E6I4_HAECO|nr:unnamed protein product [Haemonchus contortus]